MPFLEQNYLLDYRARETILNLPRLIFVHGPHLRCARDKIFGVPPVLRSNISILKNPTKNESEYRVSYIPVSGDLKRRHSENEKHHRNSKKFSGHASRASLFH